MLTIAIPPDEFWDERKQEFINFKGQVLQLEHSLVSLAKWESKWCKVFFSKQEKTPEEMRDYIRCMTITQNVDSNVYNHLTNNNMKDINDYMDAKMTAVAFPKGQSGGGGLKEPMTSDLIYYWMVALNIPFECQKWHIKRLLTLIRICNIKNTPPKKRNKKDILSSNAALNATRRKQLGTSG